MAAQRREYALRTGRFRERNSDGRFLAMNLQSGPTQPDPQRPLARVLPRRQLLGAEPAFTQSRVHGRFCIPGRHGMFAAEIGYCMTYIVATTRHGMQPVKPLILSKYFRKRTHRFDDSSLLTVI